jgi:hypothetical protein
LPILAARVGFLPFNEQLNAGRDDHHWHGYTARLALALQALQSLEQRGRDGKQKLADQIYTNRLAIQS